MKNTKDREKRRHVKMARQKATHKDRVASFRKEQTRQALCAARLREARANPKGLPPLSDEDYLFWLCHGANYLASDSTTGVWTPIFEDIYAGMLPAPGTVVQSVLRAYQTEVLMETFGGVPRTVVAWTVTDRAIITIYQHEAIRRLKEKDPECDAEFLARAPHNPTVWTLMDQVKERSLAAGNAMDTNPIQTE